MEIFVFDSDAPSERRPWELLLGTMEKKAVWGGIEGVYGYCCDGAMLSEDCVLIMHNSSLGDSDEWDFRQDWIKKRNICAVIISASPGNAKADGSIYYRGAALPHTDNPVFSKCFARFIQKLTTDKVLDWRLIEPALYPETLTAAYLLMVAQEKKIDVPLNSLSGKQWKEACEQYKEIRGEKDADWSNASEWGKEKIAKVKIKIRDLFSQVASKTQ